MSLNPSTYLYGIAEQNFISLDCPGIGNPPQKVHAVPMAGVSILISFLPPDFSVGLDDTIAHMKVLEIAMQNSSVIPVKFGTVVTSMDDLKSLLTANRNELKKELAVLKGKYEVGIKAYWKQDYIISDLKKRYKDHALLAAAAQSNQQAALELGQRVEAQVSATREIFEAKLHRSLSKLATEQYLGNAMSIEMLYSAAFLVTPEQEQNIYEYVQKFAEENGEKAEFHFTTKLPPYNFTHLHFSWRGQT